MEPKKRYTLYGGEVVIMFPCAFEVNEERTLPKGIMQTYPDYVFTYDREVYVSVSKCLAEKKEIDKCLRGIANTLKNAELEFQIDGAWKKKIHGLEMAKLYYNTQIDNRRWSHMVAIFESLENQYLIMAHTKMILKEKWEEAFDRILERLEIRYV